MAGEMTDEEFAALLRKDVFKGIKEEPGPTRAKAFLLGLEEQLRQPTPALPAELEIEPSPVSVRPTTVGEIGGGIVGSLVGEAIFPPGGGIPGGIAGTVVGTTLGTAAGLTVEDISGTGQEPTFVDVAQTMGEAVRRQTTAELGARGGLAVLRKALKPLPSRLLEEGAEETIRLFEEASEQALGVGAKTGLPTAGQLSRSALVDFGQGVSANAVGGQGFFVKQQMRVEKVIEFIAERFQKADLNPISMGSSIRDTLSGGRSLWFGAARGAWQGLDDMVRGAVTVKWVRGKAALREIIEDVAPRGAVPVGKRNKEIFEEANNLLTWPDEITFMQAQNLRSDLLAVFRGVPFKNRKQAVDVVLSNILVEEMEKSARALSGDALRQFRGARNLTRMGHERFNTKFLIALDKLDLDEKVYRSMLAGLYPERIDEVINILGRRAPRLKKALGDTWVTDIMVEAGKSGDFSGKTLFSFIRPGKPERFARKLLGKEYFRNVKTFATAAKQAQATVSSPGTMAIGLTQFGGGGIAGGIAGFATGDPIKGLLAAAPFFVAPAIAAKILSTSGGTRWLTVGIKAPAFTKEAAIIQSRVLANMRRIEKQEKAKRLPKEPVVPLQGPLAPIGPSLPQPQPATPTAVFGVRG